MAPSTRPASALPSAAWSMVINSPWLCRSAYKGPPKPPITSHCTTGDPIVPPVGWSGHRSLSSYVTSTPVDCSKGCQERLLDGLPVGAATRVDHELAFSADAAGLGVLAGPLHAARNEEGNNGERAEYALADAPT